MKRFTLLCCSLLAFAARADNSIYSFEQMIGISDLIVIGEIENVGESSFTFRISEALKGKVSASISVGKSDECERYAKYEKGQKLCLFLKKGLLNWSIIGGHNGERPILDETVYLGLDENYKLPLPEFSDAIVSFCNNFKAGTTSNGFNERVYFVQLGSEEELDAFRNKNKFTRWLCGQISYDEISKQ